MLGTFNCMPSSSPASPESRAEKRVLWEVKQRYNLDTKRRRTTAVPATAPTPPRKPPVTRPTRQVRPSGKRRSHTGWKVTGFMIALLLVGFSVFGYKVISTSNKISTAEKSILGQLKDLLFSSHESLAGEKDNRINVLLLAIGGEGHSGENLADTVMVASIRPSDNSIALLSIPRDLYVQVPDENFYSKLNAVHAYGEAKKKDNGPELLKRKVEEITGLPIHYYARVDFTAFKSLVDTVGGVDITIKNGFVDYWHKISFPAGTEKMNGERALAYGRARYVEGPEGGDFKRTQRQQQLLLAIRDKVFSVNTSFDFTRINGILNSLSDNIRTNMQLWEMKRFFELARQIDHDHVRSVVLSTGTNGVLVGSTEVLGGTPASILKTRTGDFSEIQHLAKTMLDDSQTGHLIAPTPQDSSSATPTPSASPSTNPTPEIRPTLEIRNGTNVTGLAKKMQDILEPKGYEVLAIGNATDRSTAKTTVYIINTKRLESGQALADDLGAASDSGLPTGEAKTQADILIILGADAAD